jgi:hypothetical protein
MQLSRSSMDRRKSPRVWMYLPLEYQMKYAPRASGGLVIDASETGFHIHSAEDVRIGTTLKIDVLLPKNYEMANVEVVAEVVWKKVSVDRRGKGYQYGLKFVQILEEDSRALRRLLSDRSQKEKGSEDR